MSTDINRLECHPRDSGPVSNGEPLPPHSHQPGYLAPPPFPAPKAFLRNEPKLNLTHCLSIGSSPPKADRCATKTWNPFSQCEQWNRSPECKRRAERPRTNFGPMQEARRKVQGVASLARFARQPARKCGLRSLRPWPRRLAFSARKRSRPRRAWLERRPRTTRLYSSRNGRANRRRWSGRWLVRLNRTAR